LTLNRFALPIEQDIRAEHKGNQRALQVPGTSDLVLAGTSTDGVDFQSREATKKPQLVITTRATGPDPSRWGDPVVGSSVRAAPPKRIDFGSPAWTT